MYKSGGIYFYYTLVTHYILTYYRESDTFIKNSTKFKRTSKENETKGALVSKISGEYRYPPLT